MFTIPRDTVQSHRGMAYVQYLKLVILVTRIEYQTAVVLPCQPAVADEVRANIVTGIVLAPVLHDHGA